LVPIAAGAGGGKDLACIGFRIEPETTSVAKAQKPRANRAVAAESISACGSRRFFASKKIIAKQRP
jgi:hypothetical protein